MHRMLRFLPALLLTTACLEILAADETPTKDLVFADLESGPLKLDLFMPENVENPPLVVFIHGGGWKAGSYKKNHLSWMPEHGFALASIGYRLSSVEIFPAQIHDCKGAIRWLRANAARYGYDASRICVIGTSAGGHLAALVGTSAGVEALEGETGGNLDESSRVQAVVNFYGPADFVLRSKSHPKKTEDPKGSVYQLLGGKASERLDLAKLASPVTHVSDDDPPMLILHGARDTTVKLEQSQRLEKVYQQAGLDVRLKIEPEGSHGGKAFFSGANREAVVAFCEKHLKAK